MDHKNGFKNFNYLIGITNYGTVETLQKKFQKIVTIYNFVL